MTKRLFFILAALLLALGEAWAYEYSETLPDGHTIFFNIDNGNASIVYPNTGTVPYLSGQAPVGELVIPEYVHVGTAQYPVIQIAGNAFRNCDGLTKVVLPEGLQRIGNYVFMGCTALTSVTIGASTTQILNQAFSGCTSLQLIQLHCDNPPALGQNVFSGVPISNVTVRTPCGRDGVYRTTSVWSGFGLVTELRSCSPDIYEVQGTAVESELGCVVGGGEYSIDQVALLSAVPYYGNLFLGWSDGDTTNPRNVLVEQDTLLHAHFGVASVSVFHDTLFVVDTSRSDSAFYSDTLLLHDTVLAFVYQYIHDTLIAYINHYVHDTVVDTHYAVRYDTITHVEHVHHIDTLYDTILLAVHDTLLLYDTLWQRDTLLLPVHDTVIAVITQYLYDTIYLSSADTVYITHYDTLVVHDTIYLFLTSDDPISPPKRATVTVRDGQVVIGGAIGQPVALFDMQGRLLFRTPHNPLPELVIDPHTSGMVVVQIGTSQTHKVVLLR